MSDYLLRRIAFLAELAEKKQKIPGRLGKTAMQKLLYLLQEGYDARLGYHFDLYTYGPYESAVMRDIDYMASTGLLDVRYEGDAGYKIVPGPEAGALQEYRKLVRQEAGRQLDEVLKHFGGLNASELELRATILYVMKDDPSLTKDRVLELVQTIKPKFSPQAIQEAIDHLVKAGLVKSSPPDAQSRREAKKSVRRASSAGAISAPARSPVRTARRKG